MTMKTLIDAFAQRLLVPAPFQRDADAWENQKRLEWAKTLGGHDRLWGTFCVYRLFLFGVEFFVCVFKLLRNHASIIHYPQPFALTIKL